MTTRAPKSSVTIGGKTIYLNNKELLAAVKQSKEVGQMSNTLAMMLQLLCSKYAKKGNFINYSYNEDMQGYAMMMLVRTWNSFDPTKSNNPFAFFTQCIKNSFIQYLNQEKRQRDVRDVMLIDQGMNPSFGFGDGTSRAGAGMEDEQNLDLTFDVIPDISPNDEEPVIERDNRGEEIQHPDK
jgi:DNA-directed RNA polymerase specialized sigma24 family protein